MIPQSIAFWELSHLSKNRADRRKSIFADVDRKPVNMWEQILQECLRCVNEVEIKINELMTPHAPAPPVTSPAVKSPSTSSLRDPPAIPVRQNNILVTTSRSPGRNLVDMVQSVDGATPSAALRKRLPIPDSFSASQSQTSVVSTMKDQMAPLLASPYGKPFRQTIQLMTTAAIPNVRIPIDAVSGSFPLYPLMYRFLTYRSTRPLGRCLAQGGRLWRCSGSRRKDSPVLLRYP